MKRKALGLLLFLLIVPFFMGCDQATTQEQTTVTTTEEAMLGSTYDMSIGTVTVEIVTSGDDPDTTEVETEYVSNSKVVKIYNEDTLFNLLDINFTVTYETSTYGRYLTGIDTLVLMETNEFISFYIDGEYAMTGVDDTDLVDGSVYSFSIGTF